MRLKRVKALAIAAGLVLTGVLAARCANVPLQAAESYAAPKLTPDFGCLPPAIPTIAPTLPADSVLTEQPEVNCFAWQQFVALNWHADPAQSGEADASVPASRFGDPGDPAPKAWETYKNVLDLFLPRGAEPEPWNALPNPPGICGAQLLAEADEQRLKVLAIDAKFPVELSDQQVLDEINQAGVQPPAFLTAQNRRLVHYEVLVNEDYFNYVVDDQNRFYDARNQGQAVLSGGQGVILPVGPSLYGATGAIELKAGWLEIERDQQDQFLTAEALIVDDDEDPPCRKALVGLVGLHIVHKTKTMPNWTWATFEHVANAPNRVEVARGDIHPPYTFYNPDCQPAGGIECQPNRKPQPGDPEDRPIQVIREVPIPGYVASLNLAMQQLIAASNPKSVFRNYRLVNTLWPQSGEEIPVGAITPLHQGGAAPTTGLSNITAETYVQSTTCLDCHQYAPIACSSVAGPNPVAASDYTFQLSRASEPNPPPFCRDASE